jgi:hypothetical protein
MEIELCVNDCHWWLWPAEARQESYGFIYLICSTIMSVTGKDSALQGPVQLNPAS